MTQKLQCWKMSSGKLVLLTHLYRFTMVYYVYTCNYQIHWLNIYILWCYNGQSHVYTIILKYEIHYHSIVECVSGTIWFAVVNAVQEQGHCRLDCRLLCSQLADYFKPSYLLTWNGYFKQYYIWFMCLQDVCCKFHLSVQSWTNFAPVIRSAKDQELFAIGVLKLRNIHRISQVESIASLLFLTNPYLKVCRIYR